jgi:hypothetical protein
MDIKKAILTDLTKGNSVAVSYENLKDHVGDMNEFLDIILASNATIIVDNDIQDSDLWARAVVYDLGTSSPQVKRILDQEDALLIYFGDEGLAPELQGSVVYHEAKKLPKPSFVENRKREENGQFEVAVEKRSGKSKVVSESSSSENKKAESKDSEGEEIMETKIEKDQVLKIGEKEVKVLETKEFASLDELKTYIEENGLDKIYDFSRIKESTVKYILPTYFGEGSYEFPLSVALVQENVDGIAMDFIYNIEVFEEKKMKKGEEDEEGEGEEKDADDKKDDEPEEKEEMGKKGKKEGKSKMKDEENGEEDKKDAEPEEDKADDKDSDDKEEGKKSKKEAEKVPSEDEIEKDVDGDDEDEKEEGKGKGKKGGKKEGVTIEVTEESTLILDDRKIVLEAGEKYVLVPVEK